MEKIRVQDSLRKKKRELNNALGDDILRYIAELLTNADDSYKRLENANIIDLDTPKVIYVEVEKNNSKIEDYCISITDNAEGMSKKELKRIFETYGANNSGGKNVQARGIFGQGASDVLRASALENKIARIESIKDNKLTILNYMMDKNLTPSIELEDVKLNRKNLEKIRGELRIPSNGTKITFGVSKRVNFKKKIRESLPTLIEKYPTFRYLLNNNRRKVVYIEPFMNTVLSSSNYQFNAENIICDESFRFKFDEKRVNCNLRLYNNFNKKNDGTNIIVRDENYIVFDNTMFAFNNSSLSENISGELTIEGLYDICYYHLNKENPDAIIRDNRTGFDTKNVFYEILCKNINPIIEKYLINNVKDIKSTDLTSNKKFDEALKKLNKYLASEIKNEITGGNLIGNGSRIEVEGIKFARENITLTKGKSYNIKLYINSEQISESDTIEIFMENNDSLTITPNKFTYKKMDIQDNLVIKNISIKACNLTILPIEVIAKVSGYEAKMNIEVIDEDIFYPKNGMEFYPSSISSLYNKPHNLKLYLDSDIVKLGSNIQIDSSHLEIENNIITFTKSNLISDKIGVININLLGGDKDKVYEIRAKFENIEALATISLVERNKQDKLGGGLISKITLEKSSEAYQSFYNQYTHVITINIDNPINIKIMGDMKDKDSSNPTFTKEQTKYLCDIIANQASRLVVKKNINNGDISYDDSIESFEEIEKIMQVHKNRIYEEMYPALLSIVEDKKK